LLNIQYEASCGWRCSGRGLVALLRRFSHTPICCNEVRFQVILPEYDLTTVKFLTLTPSVGVIHCKYRHKRYIAKGKLWAIFLSQKV